MPNQLGSSEAVTKQGRGIGRISWKGSAYGKDAEVACWDRSSCHRLLADVQHQQPREQRPETLTF